jgi:hypothetical protein
MSHKVSANSCSDVFQRIQKRSYLFLAHPATVERIARVADAIKMSFEALHITLLHVDVESDNMCCGSTVQAVPKRGRQRANDRSEQKEQQKHGSCNRCERKSLIFILQKMEQTKRAEHKRRSYKT